VPAKHQNIFSGRALPVPAEGASALPRPSSRYDGAFYGVGKKRGWDENGMVYGREGREGRERRGRDRREESGRE